MNPNDAEESRKLDAVQSTLQKVLNLAEPPSSDACLREDLAVSSYHMMEAAVILERELAAPADFGKIAQAQTVRDLARAW